MDDACTNNNDDDVLDTPVDTDDDDNDDDNSTIALLSALQDFSPDNNAVDETPSCATVLGIADDVVNSNNNPIADSGTEPSSLLRLVQYNHLPHSPRLTPSRLLPENPRGGPMMRNAPRPVNTHDITPAQLAASHISARAFAPDVQNVDVTIQINDTMVEDTTDNDNDDDDDDDNDTIALLSILQDGTIMSPALVNVPSLAPEMESLLTLYAHSYNDDNDDDDDDDDDDNNDDDIDQIESAEDIADIHIQANHVAAAADQVENVAASAPDTLMEDVNDIIFPPIDNSTNVFAPDAVHSRNIAPRPKPSRVVLISATRIVDPTTYTLDFDDLPPLLAVCLQPPHRTNHHATTIALRFFTATCYKFCYLHLLPSKTNSCSFYYTNQAAFTRYKITSYRSSSFIYSCC